jgi:EAL domain-containing protein (putative c-di-GMP-specific phosphodiesterase class I)
MAQNLVASAKSTGIQVFGDANTPLSHQVDPQEVRLLAARLLASGFHPKKVAISMAAYLSPTANPESAYHKIRRWMHRDAAFRDLIYQQAVLKLDLKSPKILDGIARSAQRGRVDAARFALEITGRHTKEETQVTQVNVVLQNIPRPDSNPRGRTD